MKPSIRAALIVLTAAAIGGAGVWVLRPELLEPPLESARIELASWRDTVDDWRRQGGEWWAELRRKGAEVANSARQAVGLEPAANQPEPLPPAAQPAVRMVVWATADGQLLRAQVPGPGHEEFVAALRQAQSEDLTRLARLAEKRFRQEAEPLAQDAAARVPAFITEATGASAQLSAISEAFSAMDGDGAATDGKPGAKDKATRLIGDRLSGLYRQHVLNPDVTVPALRAASGKVIADVRVDLIRACDRYDDAFRSFLRANVKQAEALSQDGRWVTVEWNDSGASFRSLCHTLRVGGVAASWFDEAVLRTAGEPSMASHELIRELARPAAEVVEGMSQSYDGAFGTLSSYGLPAPLARMSALVWSYGTSGPTVVSHALGLRTPPDLRTRIEPALTQATRAGVLEVAGSLNAALVAFVDGELAGIASGVTARVDGSWSKR